MNTEYKIVAGGKEAVENESNKLASEGWSLDFGSLTVTHTTRGPHYALLMYKYTPES
jgi:hypothetical protein